MLVVLTNDLVECSQFDSKLKCDKETTKLPTCKTYINNRKQVNSGSPMVSKEDSMSKRWKSLGKQTEKTHTKQSWQNISIDHI